MAPLSAPILGVFSLANYCLACQVLGKSPGEVRDLMSGITENLQGIVVAAVVAQADSWEGFYQHSLIAIEMLFWMGLISHQTSIPPSFPSRLLREHEFNAGEQQSHMLSIHGLAQQQAEDILSDINAHSAIENRVYLSLVNSKKSIVFAGPPLSLKKASARINQIAADPSLDQTRIPYNERKPTIKQNFLPISAPFHTPFLKESAALVLAKLEKIMDIWTVANLKIPFFRTDTGANMQCQANSNLVESLIDMVMCNRVHWPQACQFLGATHVLDFGPGQAITMPSEYKEGSGVRLIAAGKLASSRDELGAKAEMFASSSPKEWSTCTTWAKSHSSRVVKDLSGNISIRSNFTKLFSLPPIMVPAMTPTTVHVDTIAAVMNAGYHVELACGGYSSPEKLEQALIAIAKQAPIGRGITCNVLYASPRSLAWQIPLISRISRRGDVIIDGLTIGAGIPSLEITTGYIRDLGLKHIAFKPGSINAIREVINIAKSHPEFPVILQWTGGRGGGHHSFEDFHEPILGTYASIRKCSNIVLVSGSEFGDAESIYPYLTGEWSCKFGYSNMPFDGVMLGSRVMVAKEAHTSPEVKALIVKAPGTTDNNWSDSYKKPVGGIITVTSELGQPIHQIANRGTMFWAEMDRIIFSLDRAKRTAALQSKRDYIIRRLNSDFQKPWFGANVEGTSVDIEDMTYAEVLKRVVDLMYLDYKEIWIDETYKKLFANFAC